MQTNHVNVWAYVQSLYMRYRTSVTISVALLGIAIMLGVYQYYAYVNKQQSLQKVLAETLLEFDRAFISPELWSDIELISKAEAKQFSRAMATPFLMFLEAEALNQQDKPSDALILMEKGLAILSQRNLLYPFFALKKVLFKLNMSDEALKQEGLKELVSLAEDKKSINYDQVLYHLAEYYESIGDAVKSMEMWKELSQIERKDLMSPWVIVAKEKFEKASRE